VDDGSLVDVIDGGQDALREFLFGDDAYVAQHGARELGEEALDEVQPRAMLRIRISFDAMLVRASANRWAVTALAFRRRAVNLNQRCIINIATKSTFDGFKIWPMAVRGELDANWLGALLSHP
jgi:hypothetical protein